MVTRTQFHDGTAGTGLRQKTLKRSIPCRGIGLHSGATVTMQLCPAPADHGLRFLRTEVSQPDPWIAARHDRVIEPRLCNGDGDEDGVRVGTIEQIANEHVRTPANNPTTRC